MEGMWRPLRTLFAGNDGLLLGLGLGHRVLHGRLELRLGVLEVVVEPLQLLQRGCLGARLGCQRGRMTTFHHRSRQTMCYRQHAEAYLDLSGPQELCAACILAIQANMYYIYIYIYI